MKQYIIAFLAIIGLAAGGYAALQHQQGEFSVGGDLVTPIAGQTYTLAGSGISSAETSFTLTSFTITQTGYRIQDSDMSDVFYVTFEPGSRSRQEIASCTTVMQNADGTATISGCTRGLLPISPYTASTSLQFAHGGGSTVIFSDPPQLFNQAGFKDNDETITGSWLFPTPLSDYNAATKAYVDALVTGGTVSNDRLVVAGTAGETLATGTLVYLNPATQRWNGVSTASTTTFDDRFIGLTQGAGTNGVAVNGGVLLKGRHTLSTGLTPGAVYYGATATGTINTATSAQPVGIAVSTNVLYFDPVLIDVPHEMANNTFTGLNTFNSTTTFNGPIVGATRIDVFTSSSTWTKPTNAKWVEVIAVSGGGGGAGGAVNATDSSGGGGGQGGGISSYRFNASTLTSTVAVTVGAGGTGGAGKTAGGSGAGTSGNAGNDSSFGSYLIAIGGSGGSGGLNGAAGGSSAGQGNVATGGAGGAGINNAAGSNGSSTVNFGTTGGGGGGGVDGTTNGYAGGTGGARSIVAVLAGGTAGTANSGTGGNGNSLSLIDAVGGTGGGGGGGDSGDNAAGGIGGNGGFPGGGGGGGGSSGSTGQAGGVGGNGANGIVIVITY